MFGVTAKYVAPDGRTLVIKGGLGGGVDLQLDSFKKHFNDTDAFAAFLGPYIFPVIEQMAKESQ